MKPLEPSTTLFNELKLEDKQEKINLPTFKQKSYLLYVKLIMW